MRMLSVCCVASIRSLSTPHPFGALGRAWRVARRIARRIARRVACRIACRIVFRLACQGAPCVASCIAVACASPADQNTSDRDGQDETHDTLPERPLCTRGYTGSSVVIGRLGDADLTELSGVVVSPRSSDLLWAHNDSGNEPILYALHEDGRSRGRLRLPVAATDLEDIAVASCPDRHDPCLYLADTGNNRGDRSDQSIIIVQEPTLPDSGTFPDGARLTGAVRMDASPRAGLPEGIDIEAIAVMPDGSALFLVEKVDAPSARVFALRAPFSTVEVSSDVPLSSAPQTSRFEEVGRVATGSPARIASARMITGAAMHPSGTAMAIRTYTGVFELRFDDGDSPLVLGERLAATVAFGPLNERQGEAVSYDASGTGLLTISEAGEAPASDVPVNALPCQ